MSTGYIETLCFYADFIEYRKPVEPYMIQFVQKVFPDIHVSLIDNFNFLSMFHIHRTGIFEPCNTSCRQRADDGFVCKMLSTSLFSHTGDEANSTTSTTEPKTCDLQDS